MKGSTMSAQDVQDWIRREVAGNDGVLFLKGSTTMPQCGFSMQVAQLLTHLGLDYTDLNVLEHMRWREWGHGDTSWPTISQLYVKGEFIGGCDIVREMFQGGELEQLLTEKGIGHNRRTMTA